jgi:Uncharacterized protein conserved in bacteria (DUF2130)
MANGFQRAAMLERQGGDYCRVLCVGFGSAPSLGAVYEDLSDPAIVEPTDATGVLLATGFEPVEPVGSPVGEPLAGSGDGHVPALRSAKVPLRAPRCPVSKAGIHTIKHGKKVCGKIVYDCRNRKIWQDKFATPLHNDMVSAGAMHAILATTKFPKKGQQVCKAQGIILVHPGRVVVIADILREEVIRNFAQRVSDEDRSKKTAKLYDFITSEQFGNVLESLDENVNQLIKNEEDDRKRHKKASETREQHYLKARRLQAKLRADVGRIVGTLDTE